MSDIVEQARKVVELHGDTYSSYEVVGLLGQLVAEIERLRAEHDQFAEMAAMRDNRDADMQEIMRINNELKAEIERLQVLTHKPAVGGPPCPTCGFVITHKKAEPTSYEDEP